MALCSFCGKELNPGSGKMYVKKDGKVFYYCSSKCQTTHVDRKYKARLTPWAKEYQKEKEVRLSHDKK